MGDTSLKMQRIFEREQEHGLYRMKQWTDEKSERTRGATTLIQGVHTDPIHHAYTLLHGIVVRNTSFQGVCMDIDAKILSYITEQQTYLVRLPPPTNEFMRVWYQHYIDTFMKALYWVRQEYPQAAHHSYILRMKREHTNDRLFHPAKAAQPVTSLPRTARERHA